MLRHKFFGEYSEKNKGIRNFFIACFILILIWSIFFAAFFVQPKFNYNYHDNFEYFTPVITHTHEQWLDGDFPFVNLHQHMGESILAAGQSGPFYFPYTLSLAVVKICGLKPESLVLVITVLHICFAGIGWFILLNFLKVRCSIAFLTIISICFGGYITLITTVWINMVVVFAWLPWIIWGLLRLFYDNNNRSAALLLILGLVAQSCTGQPQMCVYVWSFAILFCLIFGFWVYKSPRRTLQIMPLFLVAALMSAPALFPMLEAIKYSSRANSFTLSAFLKRSAAPETFLGWLLPLFKVENNCIPDSASIIGYQGAWILPAIFCGIFCLMIKCQLAKKTKILMDEKSKQSINLLSRTFIALLGLSLLFCLFALGKHGFIYRWTYGIPVWSSFRWPFKFLLISQPLLALAAGVVLEILARTWQNRYYVRFTIPLFVVLLTCILLLFKRAEILLSVLGVLSLVTGLASMILVGWINYLWSRIGMVCLAIITAITLTALSHDVGMLEYEKPWGQIGTDVFGIDTEYRVLPLSAIPKFGKKGEGINNLQILSLHNSATANNYYSATGTTIGLFPGQFIQTLPCNIQGVLSRGACRDLLGTNLLRSFNICYLLVSPKDKNMQKIIDETGQYQKTRCLEDVLVYEDTKALPRAYYASHAYNINSTTIKKGLLSSSSPLKSVYISGWAGPEKLPQARIMDSDWKSDRIKFKVDTPKGGLLVVSLSYYPDWTAFVDGKKAKTILVNGRIQGIITPPGAKNVVLRYRSKSLRRGLWLFAVGLVGGGIWFFRSQLIAGKVFGKFSYARTSVS